MTRSDQKIKLTYFFVDLLLLNISIIIALFFKYKTDLIFINQHTTFVVFNLVWLLTINFFDTQIRYLYKDIKGRILPHIKSTFIFTGLLSIVLLILKDITTSRLIIYGSIAIFLTLRVIFGYLFYLFINTMRYHGKNLHNIIIIGAGRIGIELDNLFSNLELGFKIIGFLDDIKESSSSDDRIKIIGKIGDLNRILEKRNIDGVIIALPVTSGEKIRHCIQVADYYGVRVRLIPDFYHVLKRTYKIHNIGGVPIINVREYPLDELMNYISKRLFDFIFSFFALVITSPIMLIVGVKLKLFDRGEIFYRPVRLGKNGREFNVYKFRSMIENDDLVNGEKSTELNDPRITQFGHFIRKYNIDELPQFWNVILGDMSVVGPRPHRIHLNKVFQSNVTNYMVRHYIKPGITGWAQVNGWRGPTITDEQKNQRTKHDIWYMENWNLFLDLKIIFLTLASREVRRNAF